MLAARELTAEQLADYKRRYQLFLDTDVRLAFGMFVTKSGMVQ